MLGRALHPWDVAPTWLRIADDPYQFYTAALVPIVVLVALIPSVPGELVLSLGLGGAARRRPGAARSPRPQRRASAARLAWQLDPARCRRSPSWPSRPASSAVPSLPLLALYIPIVAAAAAAGTVQGWWPRASRPSSLLGPELRSLGSHE